MFFRITTLPFGEIIGRTLSALTVGILAVTPASAQNKVRIVTTLPTYAAIAREVAGERGDVAAIARGDEDPHFVSPRPSFAAMIQRADLFVVTGLDLELWVPALLDRANNQRVVEGAPGHVAAYSGVQLLDVPESVSRSGGDVHLFGNPHIHTDPINSIIIARNIKEGLERIDPNSSAIYRANLENFENRIINRLFGHEFVEMIGRETVFELARTYQFWQFVESQQYQGRPLTEFLGGWLAEASPFRNRRMVCYHKNWHYLSARFKVECSMYVEPKPGIPASPGHVREVMDHIREDHIPVVFAANYFSAAQVDRVASRTGAQGVIVAEHVDGEEGVTDYFQLVDLWVSRLSAAFRAAADR
ncbi:MAG: metal ABC transporter substrate-binding protein [Gemmatimonadota bacterium]|nr:metal ABC transporter substrate-binding protein [Gemmatimonadota bacterium]MDH5803970.1 metal ABC transporter substrate-binding protein [Gemmatimonadota bacterium]